MIKKTSPLIKVDDQDSARPVWTRDDRIVDARQKLLSFPKAERKEPKRFYEDQFCSEGFAVTTNCAVVRFWASNLFARLIVTAGF